MYWSDRLGTWHLGVVGAMGLVAGLASKGASPIQTTAALLSGSSPQGVGTVGLGIHLLVFVGAAGVIHANLMDSLLGAAYPELIRSGSVARWLLRQLGPACAYCFASVLCLVVGVLLGGWIVASLLGDSMAWSGLMPLLLFVLVVGTAQGLFYSIVLLTFTAVTGRARAGLVAIGVAATMMLPQLRVRWSPVGVASVIDSSPAPGALIAAVAPVVAWGVIACAVCVAALSCREVEFH